MSDARTGDEVWTLAEQEGGRLRPVSFELLAWGRRLTEGDGAGPRRLCAVVLGADVPRADVRELIRRGAHTVLFKNWRGSSESIDIRLPVPVAFGRPDHPGDVEPAGSQLREDAFEITKCGTFVPAAAAGVADHPDLLER